MNSFPPLIPVPADTTTKEDELTDKFATLFSPPTPRASPTPSAPTSPVIFQPLKSTRPKESFPLPSPSSPDSEFGSFVSVPPSEDPLASFQSFSNDTDAASAVIPSQEEDVVKKAARHVKTASQTFFDNFAHEAKIAHERNQRGLMDELLRQDDPLFWGKDVESGSGASSSTAAESGSLIDLDLDFFTPKHTESEDYVSHQSHHYHHHPSRHANLSSPLPSSQSPTRRSTLSFPHALAPPVASMPSVSSTPPTPVAETSDPTTDTLTSRSPSYQTLSTISSKWMSNLLPSYKSSSSPPPPNAHTNTHSSTLDTLFSHPTPSSAPQTLRHAPTFPFATPTSTSISKHSSPFAPHVFAPPSGAPGFRGEEYGWDKGFSNELERELEEGDGRGSRKGELAPNGSGDGSGSGQKQAPRGPSPSSFGDSGSGSSSEAARSRSGSRARTPVGQGSVGAGTGLGGIGGLIERKNGSVELSGRREVTVGVLDVALADMLRPHLPALSRLPRTWTLLYSLDQHGISLHTLYDKCENPPTLKPSSTSASAFGGAASFSVGASGFASNKVGEMVVVKDSGDAVFGAYLGEGVRRSRGRGYYGSGESFLWKFVDGKLQVFKWTGKNDYVALCEQEYISFGGGDGTYGLYLDASLFEGTSARCPTFENEPLCSDGTKKGRSVEFECVGLEVWGVGP